MERNDLPKNVRAMLDRADTVLDCVAPLVIADGEVQWERHAEETMDAIEAMEARGLVKLERATARETCHGFRFRAEAADGTGWESGDVDCHRFGTGEKVGRFPDGSGNLVIAVKE